MTYSIGSKGDSKLFYHWEKPALHIVVACFHALMLFHIQTLYICPLKQTIQFIIQLPIHSSKDTSGKGCSLSWSVCCCCTSTFSMHNTLLRAKRIILIIIIKKLLNSILQDPHKLIQLHHKQFSHALKTALHLSKSEYNCISLTDSLWKKEARVFPLAVLSNIHKAATELNYFGQTWFH